MMNNHHGDNLAVFLRSRDPGITPAEISEQSERLAEFFRILIKIDQRLQKRNAQTDAE